ncbi:MAG: hypothetical protein LRY28_01175 [Erysipelotrichaceae bacterium]|jgi:hypothetical protein|nr:hypothetical protein [Erysipelotrichaceae bacterium]
MQFIAPLLFLGFLGGVYASAYYLNLKTPKPEGCDDVDVSCGSCSISSCGLHPSNKELIVEVKS